MMAGYRPAALLLAVLALVVVGGASRALAQDPTPPPGTRCAVEGGPIIPCDDPGISDADRGCPGLHYHGELNGVADPDPTGCGHGLVVSVAPEEPDRSGLLNSVLDYLDALFQGISGGFSPKTVYDTVDIVEDEASSLAATKENAEEYFEAYPDAEGRPRFTLEDENPEENAPIPSLYRWFWSWFE